MSTFSIIILSASIGFLICYLLMATCWILLSINDASWGNGWYYGYRSGLEDAEKRDIECNAKMKDSEQVNCETEEK